MVGVFFALLATVEAMISGGLRGAFLSTPTNVRASDKPPNQLPHPPFFIASVTSWPFLRYIAYHFP